MREYLESMREYRLLTPKEKQEINAILRCPFTTEDEKKQAREKLVYGTLRLVCSIACKHHISSMVSLDDLIQEGCIGLMRAAMDYDPKRSNSFTTYATPWIIKEVKRYKLSFNRRGNCIDTHNKYIKFKAMMEEPQGTSPLSEKGAKIKFKEITGTTLHSGTLKYFFLLYDMEKRNIPFFTDIANTTIPSSSPTPYDILSTSEQKIKMSKKLEELIDSVLTPKEKKVLSLIFEIGKFKKTRTLDSAGFMLYLSRERVRQILKRALEKLRESIAFDDY